MPTGLSASLQDIKDSRKTAVINDELKRLNVDIATLQETRLADSGTLVTLCTALLLLPLGRGPQKSYDWFEAESTVMTPVIETKRAALAECVRIPSERNLQILRIARSKAQQTARRCSNEYWT